MLRSAVRSRLIAFNPDRLQPGRGRPAPTTTQDDRDDRIISRDELLTQLSPAGVLLVPVNALVPPANHLDTGHTTRRSQAASEAIVPASSTLLSSNVKVDPKFPEAKILDVTLRDGGFAVDFKWTEQAVVRIARSLAQTGIQVVELGYYGGGVPEPPRILDKGITANVPLPLIEQLSSEHPETEFALMIHPDITDNVDFRQIADAGATLVRFVYHPAWDTQFRRFVIAAQAEGLQTSLNISLVSKYAPDTLLHVCEELSRLAPNMIYLADTCSALYPHQVSALFTRLGSIIDIPLGFHAHDFLSLAFANALAAAQASATYVDASILGLGRGAGNLRSEIWSVCAVAQEKGSYLMEHLLDGIECAREYVNTKEQDITSIVAGACNLTPAEEEHLRSTGKQSLSAGSMDLLACRYVMNKASLQEFTSDSLKRS